MHPEIPSQEEPDFDLLAQNDPKRTLSERVGYCSIVAWRHVADLFDTTVWRSQTLPEIERCQEVGNKILHGVGIVVLATSILLIQDPNGL